MNDRFYLIRKTNGVISGPFNQEEIRKLYESQNISLQDEISATQHPWVFLKNRQVLRKTYPQINDIVKKQEKLEWADSDHPTRIHRTTSQWVYAVPAFVFLVVTGIAGAYWYKVQSIPNHTTVLLMRAHEVQHQRRGFALWMNDNLRSITLEMKDPLYHDEWLTFIRKFAFQTTGKVTGINSSILRGDPLAPTPTRCSLDAWVKRWKNKSRQWKQAPQPPNLNWPDWLYILTWDPHWIRQHRQEGWTQPNNYLAGCLIMAQKGLDEVLEDKNFTNKYFNEDSALRRAMTWISSRLRWQNHFLTQSSAPSYRPSNKLMGPWWCIESSQELDFEKCPLLPSPTADQKKSIELRQIGQIARLLFNNNSLEVDISLLTKQLANLDDFTDPLNGLDYSAEVRFLSLLIKTSGQRDFARARFSSEFSKISLNNTKN